MKLSKWLKFDLFIIVVLMVIAFAISTYTVEEDEVAVIRRFGKITKVIVNTTDKEKVIADLKEKGHSIQVSDQKGLSFKAPFVDEVTTYSSKYMTYISSKETINTLDRRKIDIQMYSQYRVVNPATVLMTLGNRPSEWNKMQDDKVYPVVVQSANMLRFDDFFNKEMIDKVLDEKTKSLSEELSKQYGIAVIDIGIHRKNFPEVNLKSIEEKMVKEIKKDSEKLRAEGDSQYIKDTSEAERMKQEIVAKGIEEAATIKAQADAEAMSIYEQALRKDLEFYRFVQRINTYKTLRGTTVFVDSDNEFLNYINGY